MTLGEKLFVIFLSIGAGSLFTAICFLPELTVTLLPPCVRCGRAREWQHVCPDAQNRTVGQDLTADE